MVHAAEPVGHAELAAVANEQDVDLAELRAALRAADRPLVERGGLGHLACLPVWSLDRPGNYVLEAAKRGRRSPAGS
jgi:hypothetical protein